MLERLAEREGDAETVALAREMRTESEAAASWLAAAWDRFVGFAISRSEGSRA
jgi:hypothetical protein